MSLAIEVENPLYYHPKCREDTFLLRLNLITR
jgi:hypothetical protein